MRKTKAQKEAERIEKRVKDMMGYYSRAEASRQEDIFVCDEAKRRLNLDPLWRKR